MIASADAGGIRRLPIWKNAVDYLAARSITYDANLRRMSTRLVLIRRRESIENVVTKHAPKLLQR